MPDPLNIVGEILGEPAHSMRDPVNAGYRCPFINSECVKRGHNTEDSYPVCSVYRKVGRKRDSELGLTCVCPKRFYEADILQDIIAHCWVGDPPENPRIAHEIKMASFGNVDFVVADVDASRNLVRQFVSVELQAVDIIGTVADAYDAILNSVADFERKRINGKKRSNGINWANVRKRYVTSLITKGIFHHHWGTRMVSVIQAPLYEYLRRSIDFDVLPANQGNIVFMVYDYQQAPEKGVDGARKLVFERAIGTSHSSLMTGVIYRKAPDRQEFCKRILKNLLPSN